MASKQHSDQYADFLDFLKKNPRLTHRLLRDVRFNVEKYNGADGDDGKPSPIFSLNDDEIDRLVREYSAKRAAHHERRNDHDEDDEANITGKTWSM